MYLLFSWRYFKAKKSTNAINIIAWISMLAIAVGAAALVLVLSVFNGFESLVGSLYSSFYADLKVSPRSGKVMVLSAEELAKIRKLGNVQALSCIAEEKAILQNGDYQATVSLKGVDTAYETVSGVKGHIIRGKYNIGTAEQPRMILGVGLEYALGVLSDRAVYPLTVYLPKKGMTISADPMASISEGSVMPSGSFAIQQDFDNKYVLTNLATAKSLLGFSDSEYSAVEIKVKVQDGLQLTKDALQALLGPHVEVLTRFEQNKSLYTVMRVEKWAIYAILVLILAVAAFNMVGALTMLVLEKQKDIQVLKALGAEDGFIRRIFLWEGIVLAGLGTCLGIGCALLLCWLQVKYALIPLQGGSFVIDYYPVKIIPADIAIVVGTIFVVAALASWYPARRASMERVDLRS